MCNTCFYDKGSSCKVLRSKVDGNCYAWDDEAEAKKREASIKKYADPYSGSTGRRTLSGDQIEQQNRVRAENAKKRAGKSVKEVLDERFMELYQQGMTDGEIGDLLGMNYARVYDYRHDKGLVANNKKNRSTAIEAAM